MLTLRRSNERGAANHGWLDTKHTFSFARYYDPRHMGYRTLRVINDDRVAPGTGFGMHPHEEMEIVSYVVSGKLAHQDSAGHQSTLGRGGVQFMSAGTGISHSEFNGSKTEPVHLLQIWILPAQEGTAPRYGEKDFNAALDTGAPVLLVSGDGRKGSIQIGQDVDLYGARLAAGSGFEHKLVSGRGAWIQIVSGTIIANGQKLEAGDAVAIEDVAAIAITAENQAEFLLFDIA